MLPLLVPTERLPLRVLAPASFRLFFRMQKARSSSRTKATTMEPKIMPTRAPTVNPLLEWDDSPVEPCVVRVSDPA